MNTLLSQKPFQKHQYAGHISSVMANREKVRVQITQNDIENWRQSAVHPLSRALWRCTNTHWRAIDSIMLVEKVPPFRSVYLGSELLLQLHDCKRGEQVLPLDCELELRSPFTEI